MQKKKNIILLILLVILIIITAGVVYTFETSNNSKKEERIFAVEDINEVDQVEINFKGSRNVLTKKNEKWVINNKYGVDEDLSAVLLAVLLEVKATRAVARQEKDSIMQALITNGALVKVYSGDQILKSFYTGGNEQRNASFFMLEGSADVYITGIPGYNSYVSGIFELEENNWKQKEAFSSDWSSIISIKVEYPEFPEKGFEVQSKSGNINIPGVQNLDTIKLSDYMDVFRSFKADYHLQKGENVDYEKLIDGSPDAIISLQDLDAGKNNTLKIYTGMQEDSYWPAIVGETQLALFHRNKLQQLLLQKSDFEKKN